MSQTRIVSLPNGAVFGGQRFTQAEIRKLGGPDDDFMADEEQQRDPDFIDKLISRCCVAFLTADGQKSTNVTGIFAEGLLQNDMYFLLIEIRRYTLGNMYSFPATCTSCKKPSRRRLDLSKLRVVPQAEDFRFLREFSINLAGPDDPPLLVTWLAPSAQMNPQLQQIRKMYPKERRTRELFLFVKQINGTAPTYEDLSTLLGWAERNTLRAAMDARQGGIDTDLEHKCPHCSVTYRAAMPVEFKDFFLPRAHSGIEETEARPYLSSGETSYFLGANATGSPAKSEPSPTTSGAST